ncbi:GapA-binding peptide SR1P [Paenibacillus cremeus]|uniref:GapA-binding peptide SR1P n=1 Tax=Paenibacillus cremeus TaxID=2163881 RepID=UPI0021BD1852|nr:GapA-binding peptide SR1P [Paenibacillus cremeus]
MESTARRLNLGVILCKHCMTVIDTIDSEKVTTYYSDCHELECFEKRARQSSQAADSSESSD